MKIIARILLICTFLCLFAACKKTENPFPDQSGPDSSESGPATTEEPTILDSLPQVDYEAKEFVFMAFSGDGLINKDETQTGDAISEISYKRTCFVEDLYNMELRMYIPDDRNKTYEEFQKNHLGGGTDLQLGLPHPTEGMTATLTSGFCSNFLDLGNLSLDEKWYHRSQVENYQTNGKLYLLSTDWTVAGEGCTGIVYNKELYTSLGGQTDLYGLVKDGDWTLETFMEEIKSLNSTGLGEDGTHGTYSLAINRNAWESGLMYGCDIQTVRRDDNNQYALNITEPDMVVKIDRILELVGEVTYELPSVYCTQKPLFNVDLPNSEFLNLFLGKKSVFMPWDVGSQYHLLRERTFSAGYLPMPKFDSYQQDYRTICAAGCMVIPSALSPEDREVSAAVLEALSRYSYLYTRPAFFETVIGGRLSENPDDYDALVGIIESKYYDIGHAFDSGGVMRRIVYKLAVQDRAKTCAVYMKQKKAIMNMILNTINGIE